MISLVISWIPLSLESSTVSTLAHSKSNPGQFRKERYPRIASHAQELKAALVSLDLSPSIGLLPPPPFVSPNQRSSYTHARPRNKRRG